MSSSMPVSNKELHRTGRIAWLRAAVLGANDGILSTSSLVPPSEVLFPPRAESMLIPLISG